MRYLKKKDFNRVQAFEMGWSPVGMPFMTVHFYIVDGLCIDTGFRRMQKEAVVSARQHKIHRILLTHHHEDHSGNAAALKKICRYDFESFFCAHNPQLKNGKKKLQNKLQFLEDIYGTVKGFQAKGLGLDEVIDKIGLRENYYRKIFCFGNLSMRNMVRSAMAD